MILGHETKTELFTCSLRNNRLPKALGQLEFNMCK